MRSSDADVVTRVRRAVAEALKRHRGLRSRRTMVVAVSGGADSLCLLDALVAVVSRPTRRLVVGHVDHQLRPDSAADGDHVRTTYEAYGLPGAVVRVDVPRLAASERLGVEEAARLGRYRALGQLADEHGATILLTGHTLDDSVETVLLHLLRGTGTRGLGGISETQRMSAGFTGDDGKGSAGVLTLLRPLLGVGRADTVAYCEARGITYLTDPTNSDPRMLRNRVRAHLLPVLRTYNPAIDRALGRLLATARDDDAWLATLTARTWRRIKKRRGQMSISLEDWRRQPPAVQRRLVRLVAEENGVRDLDADAVERVLAMGLDDGPSRASLGRGLVVTRGGGYLSFLLQRSDDQ